jgi:hypothetical protein
MSLDVYLELDGAEAPGGSGIFMRRGGQTVEITREEWEAAFPGTEPCCLTADREGSEVFSANVTHNLNRMAQEAGIYEYLWRPDEIRVTTAAQLIEPLRAGLAILESDPDRFKAHNPENGWGSYDDFVPWVRRYLGACERWPEAKVSVSR